MQSLRGPSLGKTQTWVGLGVGCWPGDPEGRKEKVRLAAAAPHGCPFPEAEAMPASLSYEELVRRNVVGPGQSGWGSRAVGPAQR